ncbi:hypothetical protein JCGZ_22260 [Jatropha curcas]|uniref:Uncharacterized protein n=1 Tax=Jatropha curcas TaxID=180498 RepID=A0A067K571_JATCU|nr:hypothetical protein JCGZ_22260 [Jatropha curcas]
MAPDCGAAVACNRAEKDGGGAEGVAIATSNIAFRIRVERRGDVVRPDLQRRGNNGEKLR